MRIIRCSRVIDDGIDIFTDANSDNVLMIIRSRFESVVRLDSIEKKKK